MGRIRGGHSWGTLDNTCHVPFSLILQCYKSLYLISENACAWVWKVSKNVSVLCTERNERALNLITVQWRNMLHVSQVIFLLSSQILLIWQYTLSYLRNLLRDFAHPWEGIDGAVPGAVVAPLPVEMHLDVLLFIDLVVPRDRSRDRFLLVFTLFSHYHNICLCDSFVICLN